MKKNPLEDKEYATKDLHFAAFLQLRGLVITRLERDTIGGRGGKPVYFVFEDRDMCNKMEDVFWSGVGEEIMVNAKDYFTTIRDLRSRIFSIKDGVDKSRDSIK